MNLPLGLLLHDVFNTEKAAAHGLTGHDLDNLVRRDELRRLKRGWYTTQRPQFPDEWHRLRTLVELGDYPGTVAAGPSALVLLDLPTRRHHLTTVHLVRTGAGRAQQRARVVIHGRPADFARAGNTAVPSLACLQATLLDPLLGLMAADAALHRGLVAEPNDITQRLAGFRGHRGIVAARRALELADGRRESPGESEVAWVCHHLAIPLEPQVRLRGRSGREYRVDFLIRGTRVVLEYDGEGKYTARDVLLAEKAREDDLRAAGYSVIRVTKEMLRNPRLLASRLTSTAAA